MINQEQLRDSLQAACQVHGKFYSEALLTGWSECTKSVSDKQFKDVFWQVATDKFPKPSDLLQAVAGINPTDDWEIIMAVATGRTQIATINGYAAAALKQIGGVRSLATANDITTRQLHQQWLTAVNPAGLASLPAGDEQISLHPTSLKPAVYGDYQPDLTGEFRANALIKLLLKGTMKPEFAKRILSGSGKKLGLGEAESSLPAAQRDRVLATIAEIQHPEWQCSKGEAKPTTEPEQPVLVPTAWTSKVVQIPLAVTT